MFKREKIYKSIIYVVTVPYLKSRSTNNVRITSGIWALLTNHVRITCCIWPLFTNHIRMSCIRPLLTNHVTVTYNLPFCKCESKKIYRYLFP
jgi:hypothetical protein